MLPPSHLQWCEFKLCRQEKILVLCTASTSSTLVTNEAGSAHEQPPKPSHCSGLVKNYILCIHPSSSGVNAFSTASSVAQCWHCNISGRNAIVNWKCKPWRGGSRSQEQEHIPSLPCSLHPGTDQGHKGMARCYPSPGSWHACMHQGLPQAAGLGKGFVLPL